MFLSFFRRYITTSDIPQQFSLFPKSITANSDICPWEIRIVMAHESTSENCVQIKFFPLCFRSTFFIVIDTLLGYLSRTCWTTSSPANDQNWTTTASGTLPFLGPESSINTIDHFYLSAIKKSNFSPQIWC